MIRQRRTRIVATLGPASRAPAMVRELAEIGVDVFRLNFSHGAHADHAAALKAVREAELAVERPLAALADLQGPKFRLGHFAQGRIGVDWIALSFVQHAADMAELRKLVAGRAAILAKIEKPAALDDLEAILDVSDGLMVARGDLGVELAPEEVPVVQKLIVRAARRRGAPVIIATQMLESMTANPSPTRAEASDVANGVYEGADALMLSAESASGAYPREAVTIMDAIIRRVEADPNWPNLMRAEHGLAAD